MKKITFILMLFAVLFIISCDDTTNDPRVRINTDGVEVYYGLKFGNAVFGPIPNNTTTGYDDTEEGSYYLYVKNAPDGDWVILSDGKLGPVEARGKSTGKYNKYTIYLDSWGITLSEDN